MKKFSSYFLLFLFLGGCLEGYNTNEHNQNLCDKVGKENNIFLMEEKDSEQSYVNNTKYLIGGLTILGLGYFFYEQFLAENRFEADQSEVEQRDLLNKTIVGGVSSLLTRSIQLGAGKVWNYLSERERRAVLEHAEGLYSTKERTITKQKEPGFPSVSSSLIKDGVSYTAYSDEGRSYLVIHNHGRDKKEKILFEDLLGEKDNPKLAWYKEGLEIIATSNISDIEQLFQDDWSVGRQSSKVFTQSFNLKSSDLSNSVELFKKVDNLGYNPGQWIHSVKSSPEGIYCIYSASYIDSIAKLYLGHYQRNEGGQIEEKKDTKLYNNYFDYAGSSSPSKDHISVGIEIIGEKTLTVASQRSSEELANLNYFLLDMENNEEIPDNTWNHASELVNTDKFQYLGNMESVKSGQETYIFWRSSHNDEIGAPAGYAKIMRSSDISNLYSTDGGTPVPSEMWSNGMSEVFRSTLFYGNIFSQDKKFFENYIKSNGTTSGEEMLLNNPGHETWKNPDVGLQYVSNVKGALVKDGVFVAMTGRKIKGDVNNHDKFMTVKLLNRDLTKNTSEIFMEDGEYFLSEVVASDTENSVEVHYSKREADGFYRKVKTFYLGDKPNIEDEEEEEPTDNSSGNNGGSTNLNTNGNLGTGTGSSSGGSNIGIIAGVAAGGVVVLGVGGFLTKRYLYKRPRNNGSSNLETGAASTKLELNPMMNGDQSYANLDDYDDYHALDYEYYDLCEENDPKAIEPNQIKLGKQLGSGAFGVVCLAKVPDPNNKSRWIEAAAKESLILEKGLGDEEIKALKEELKNEAEVMNTLEKCQYILTPIYYTRDFKYIITELIKGGSIGDLIEKKIKENPNKSSEELVLFENEELATITKCLALGMKYMAEQNVVHRDIAARNVFRVLRLSGGVVEVTGKIGDMGLARITDDGIYTAETKRKLPIAWMAPESIDRRTFSKESDIWSFGVTMWEMMSCSKTPYPQFPRGNKDRSPQILSYIKSGGRMEAPARAPKEMADVMKQCWIQNPRDRIRAEEIASRMEKLVKKLGGNHTIPSDAVAAGDYYETEPGS